MRSGRREKSTWRLTTIEIASFLKGTGPYLQKKCCRIVNIARFEKPIVCENGLQLEYIRTMYEDGTLSYQLCIFLFDDTTIKQIESAWKEVRNIRKKLYWKHFDPENIKIKRYYLRSLKNSGMSYNKIAKHENDMVSNLLENGRKQDAFERLVLLGIESEDAGAIVEEGPTIIQDNYPIDKPRIVSLLRSI